ncbi:uncharacterized protein LOC133300927 [Gastrolobium bilobum]|uniref:uncharacterized protein LOC133300927 n=1 Tax=Gastrolobium bilobum TaxID=150636 RepID=UPI002AB064B3|nr:uncharacterized protein LOC133300927 [Gastrolobium bilobum]
MAEGESTDASATVTQPPSVSRYPVMPLAVPDFYTNPSHPFFLHPNESPSTILVPQLLNGNNYHMWSRAMTVVLISKNKIGFIDGSMDPPLEDDPSYFAWQRCNNMISDLPEEIYRLKQGDKDVTEYFTELKTLFDALDNLKPLPICSCSTKCSCGGYLKMKDYRDRDYIIRFLKGLNEQYSQVRSQIILLKPFLDVSQAFSMVTQQERQFQGEIRADNNQSFAGFSDNASFRRNHGARGFRRRGRVPLNNYGGGRTQLTKICTHCGGFNHTVETCFHLYGFPQAYKSRNPAPHATNIVAQNASDIFTSKSDSASSVTLSGDQYQHILSLL